MRKFLLVILCALPLAARAQSLDQLIQLAQDSTVKAFQSRYEYEYYQQHYGQFRRCLRR